MGLGLGTRAWEKRGAETRAGMHEPTELLRGDKVQARSKLKRRGLG